MIGVACLDCRPRAGYGPTQEYSRFYSFFGSSNIEGRQAKITSINNRKLLESRFCVKLRQNAIFTMFELVVEDRVCEHNAKWVLNLISTGTKKSWSDDFLRAKSPKCSSESVETPWAILGQHVCIYEPEIHPIFQGLSRWVAIGGL